MSQKFGPRIKSMILHGTATYSNEKFLQNYRNLRDTECWNDSVMLSQYKLVYNNDIDLIAYLWNKYIDLAVNKFGEYYPDGLLMTNAIASNNDRHSKIYHCPSLILYGDQDDFIDMEQITYLANNLPNNRLIIFKKCGHHLHQEDPIKFKNIVEKFLLENFWNDKNCLY